MIVIIKNKIITKKIIKIQYIFMLILKLYTPKLNISKLHKSINLDKYIKLNKFIMYNINNIFIIILFINFYKY